MSSEIKNEQRIARARLDRLEMWAWGEKPPKTLPSLKEFIDRYSSPTEDLLEAAERTVAFYSYAEYGPIADLRVAIRKARGEA